MIGVRTVSCRIPVTGEEQGAHGQGSSCGGDCGEGGGCWSVAQMAVGWAGVAVQVQG